VGDVTAAYRAPPNLFLNNRSPDVLPLYHKWAICPEWGIREHNGHGFHPWAKRPGTYVDRCGELVRDPLT